MVTLNSLLNSLNFPVMWATLKESGILNVIIIFFAIYFLIRIFNFLRENFRDYTPSYRKPHVKRERPHPKPEKCEFSLCQNKLVYLKDFKCSYCSKWFCDAHRLPEDHNCAGKVRTPASMQRKVTSIIDSHRR